MAMMVWRYSLLGFLIGAFACAGSSSTNQPNSAVANSPRSGLVDVPAFAQTTPAEGWWLSESPCPEGTSLAGKLECEDQDGDEVRFLLDPKPHCPAKTTLTGKVYCELEDGKEHGPYVEMQEYPPYGISAPPRPEGRKSSHGVYVNGEKHGVWNTWLVDTRVMETTYRDGLLDGRARRWSPGKHVYAALTAASPEVDYSDDFRRADDNVLAALSNLVDSSNRYDLAHSGKLVYEGMYRAGVPEGRHRYWFNGKVVKDFTITDGTGTFYRFDDGKISEKTGYRNGKRHGLRTVGAGGFKSLEESYVDGKLHGLRTVWVDGLKTLEESYADGEFHGTRRQWTSAGWKSQERMEVEGVYIGTRTLNTVAGIKILEESYVKGLAHGVIRYWKDSGELLDEFEMNMGTGVWNEWSRGTKLVSAPKRNGKKHGTEIRYSGEKEWRCDYKADQKHGKCSESEASSLEIGESWIHIQEGAGSYHEGKRVGRWVEGVRGSKTAEGTYKAGLRHGLWTFWDSDGDKRAKGHFKAGEMVGDWTTWGTAWPIKKARSVGEFHDGARHGKWMTWDEEGPKTVEDTYHAGELRRRRIWSQGQRVSDCSYNGEASYDDTHHGVCSTWHANGQIESACGYADGAKNGLCQRWHENGQVESKCEYVDEFEHGLCGTWYANGAKHTESDYTRGTERSWSEDGELEWEDGFDDDDDGYDDDDDDDGYDDDDDDDGYDDDD